MEFIDYPEIDRLVKSGKISDDQIRLVQKDIMKGLGDTVPGTGGFKKIRCPGTHSGKRGGWRIYFAEYPEYEIVIMITAFFKSQKEDLSQQDKNAWRKAKKALDQEVQNYVSKQKKFLR